ncbi:acetate kinase [Anaerotardibacter muris]|uniref:acetate kinase n=1 Tax=Anaerotardibacter muris TaxID=2941505 RepID=UPI002041CEEF|nr:acetate kinase [Anaerotardibacter muris]
MNILVINAGSSSLKYQLVDIDTNKVLARGLCERVGSPDGIRKHVVDDNEVRVEQPLKDHTEALELVINSLLSGEDAVIESLDEIGAVGHRVVHGGEYFKKSALIDDEVIAKIDELAELAPLHNKAALAGIEACRALMPETPMVAVFDTAFFQSMPPKSYMYPIPYEYYEKYGIRKYGFHGTSHRYLSERAADILGEDIRDLRIITCHLGNGCSIAAIDHGVPIDTSMGFTPLDGLMMGTRSGSIDPAIVTFLMEHEGLSAEEMNNILNKQSGLLGVSGISNDLRMVRDASNAGDERAILAYEMYSSICKKYIGQYMALMSGADVIVLSAGVGENCQKMRRMIFTGWQPLGIILDQEKNKQRGFERIISQDDSDVAIIVIPTDEEYMIARDTYEIIHENSQIVPISAVQNEFV